MPYRAHARQRRRRARRREPAEHLRSSRRTLWQAVAVLAGSIVALVLVLSAWTDASPRAPLGTAPARGGELLPSGEPVPIVVARVGALSLKLPIAREAVTAIGYHASPDTVSLSPEGTQVNEGFFAHLFHRITGSGGGGVSYYQLSGGVGVNNGALDIGAPKRSDVFAPIDGKVVQVGPYVINGYSMANRIDIRPDADPTLIVSITRLRVDPELEIGEPVSTGETRIGAVVDLSMVQHQALARYSGDPGNHVTVEVRPAALPTLS